MIGVPAARPDSLSLSLSQLGRRLAARGLEVPKASGAGRTLGLARLAGLPEPFVREGA